MEEVVRDTLSTLQYWTQARGTAKLSTPETADTFVIVALAAMNVYLCEVHILHSQDKLVYLWTLPCPFRHRRGNYALHSSAKFVHLQMSHDSQVQSYDCQGFYNLPLHLQLVSSLLAHILL